MKITKRHIAGAVVGVALAGLALAHNNTVGVTCHSINGLPDPNCTPGVIDQTKTAQILCNPSYTTKSVRPSVSYTNNLKKQQLSQYDYTDKTMSNYEEDHLISLEIGGSPTDPKNLWPEPWQATEGAHVKDKVENQCHKLVCEGKLTLQEAQKEISTNWETACQK